MSANCEIVITDSLADLASTGAAIFATTARRCVAEKDLFVVALSGGSTPRPMHRLLAEEPHRSAVPWSKTHIFWVDERCVPKNDPASNFGTAKKDLLNKVAIPAEQIYPMPAEDLPEEGAKRYEMELQTFFQQDLGKPPVLDLILLGIGNDGHTASLFPGHPVLDEGARWIVDVSGGNPNVSRLTMTFPVLNHANHVVFLVAGMEKAEIVRTVLEGEPSQLPAGQIQPQNGKLTWLLDQEAAILIRGV
jgi:6-phosphogluconolactonase